MIAGFVHLTADERRAIAEALRREMFRRMLDEKAKPMPILVTETLRKLEGK